VLAGGSPYDFAGLPRWFCFSAFWLFDRCPRQYALRYLCGFAVEVRRPAMDFGTAAHAAFERFTRERRHRARRGEEAPDRSELGRWFEDAGMAAGLPADDQRWRKRAEPMLDHFFGAESGREAETIVEEAGFRFGLSIDQDTRVTIAGYVDRIDRRPSGGVEVIDYKTGAAGSTDSAESSLQLSIYALGCREALGFGTPDLATLYYVEHDHRVSCRPTDDAMGERLADLRGRVLEIRGSDFAPRPSACACAWCDFARFCGHDSNVADPDKPQ
jgi:RecB family exonuclease